MQNQNTMSLLELQLIKAIARRASMLFDSNGFTADRGMIIADVIAVHTDSPLKLEELLNSEGDGDFAHDICGIRENLNRQTGKLENCFVPRFAL